MPQSPMPTPTPRVPRYLLLLAGVCVTVLTAAIVALPIWLASLPQAPALQPRHIAESPPVSDAGATASQPAQWEGLSRPERQADQPGQRNGSPRASSAPIIDRQWSQSDTFTTSPDLGGLLRPATALRIGHKLDRSPEARRRRVQMFGGTPRTEDAVEAGLAWLAAHQEADGTWDRFWFSRHCPADDRCPGAAVQRTDVSLKCGLTGLALLAFLGAGYTDRDGPAEYQQVVRQAVQALLRAQMPDGGFGGDDAMAGYNDTLAAFALAECYALTGEQQLVATLERAIARLVLSQQQLGGWDYLPNADSGRNDTSITAWAVQALQACAAAGLHVPPAVLIKAALHFERAAGPDGRVWYSDAGTGFQIDQDTLEAVHRYGPAMTAAGLTSEQLLGWRSDSGLVRRQQALLLGELPSVTLLQGGDPTQLHSYYYWYYGTIAMFQAGGEYWERWNAQLRDAILPLQDRRKHANGRKYHAHGSWPPFGHLWGKWGRMGGRVYTTALCVLTLEIYYRHTPAYLETYSILEPGDWRAFLAEAEPRERLTAVRALSGMRLEVAELVLIDRLRDSDRSVALAAAAALAMFDSPLGRPLLEQFSDTVPSWERGPLAEALRRAREIEALPPARGTVRMFDAEQRLATLELPRAYVGMTATVQRDGQSVAELRVIRRFSDQPVVVAELVSEPTGAPPRPGDTLLAH